MVNTIARGVFFMKSVVSAIQNTVSISMFNRGMAGKIFEDVKKFGTKVVMKNNTAECVLMSPEEYVEIMDAIEDAYLLELATSRMENFSSDETISQEDIIKKYGITEEDLEAVGEVELE